MRDKNERENELLTTGLSRRDFIKTASMAAVVAAVSGSGALFASGNEKIRVGVIGCGGRGTGAALDCAAASPDVVITAMGDLFPDMVENSLKRLREKLPAERVLVTPETCFSGFDAYEKVVKAEVDLVILAAPPFFRPAHLKAAIEAGKHVFMEKPVAVDPVGVRSVIASSELARQKGLAIVAGTQRRHQAHYVEIMKRIQ
ncbi:MAG: Gfo/Idh/MocA family oxidoreductase, partial [Candidatus Saccharicenans sp.]|nr:Gfo/Idh/MocA family oxidoreductase [Candidatus Saccharicenans sp.]